ncbi:ERF family protein [Robertmurraya siralis]|uniref:ERF family protein n=1 Tax=Robertmurraya siralis TaxID=77777 RepID=UPI0010F83867|nr:ERF family protein [Robertmurraya siralis]
MKTSESIAEIAKALGTFQQEVKQPEKSGENPHFKSKYVTLDGTVKAIHDCAPKHGLSYTQMPVSNENGVGVVTVIFHTSGQFIEFDPFILPLEKKTAQGVGSATTYARRYSLSSAFGIVSDVDDDGNEAEKGAPQNTHQKNDSISSKQVGMVKSLVKELALHGKVEDSVIYESLAVKLKIKFSDVTELTKQQASQAISILNGWKEEKINKKGA